LSVIEGLDPGYLNAGLMKPRRGLTPTTGKKKLGWARDRKRIRLQRTFDKRVATYYKSRI